jgi:alkylhydroperoxidase family enzyme
MPRIAPLSPPYEPAVEERLSKMMPPGVPPIGLFRTFAVNLPMATARAPWGGYELSRKLSLSLRDREIVIDRTCARCGCEYEWGVHIAFFADAANLTADQVTSLTHGTANDACWADERDRVIVAAVDSLHDHGDIDDALWERLRPHLTDEQFLDLTMLCGWYHAISFTARSARVDLEPGAPRFDDVRG